MNFVFKPIEKVIYLFRDIFWEYPDFLFFSRTSAYKKFEVFYNSVRPFSHIVASIIFIAIAVIFSVTNYDQIVRANNSRLIEGVLVGVDESGNRNTIQKVNPLVISSIQIEKDLNDLIYESLVNVDVDGEVQNQLIEAIVPNTEGDNYRIKLREDVYWHDSTDKSPHQFTAKDVEATFTLLEQLDFNSSTKSIYSTIANKRIKFIPVDDFRFEFELDGAIANFYELITFKILPQRYIDELNVNSILTSDPYINRNPVGTGKFKFSSADKDSIILVRNDSYYGKDNLPKFDQIKFKFYEDEDSIVEALESGQIHSAAGLSTKSLARLKDDKNITLHRTGTIYTQFYAIFFNLGENGNKIFKDALVRRAVSSAINRNYLIEILEGEAEEAYGPIGRNSFAFADVQRYTFDQDKANAILDQAGWKYEENAVYRSKDGETLEFNLLALDNVDRNKISASLVQDLANIGVKVNLEIKAIQNLNQENVLPRNFDTLLFGATTFIDPDRFELFHSSQIQHPGLNITSYISTEETVKVVEKDGKKDVAAVPEVDVRLEDGRRLLDKEKRKVEYKEFQRIIASEMPMVFLYHPILNYAVNNRVKNVDIHDANTLEERFLYVDDWVISL